MVGVGEMVGEGKTVVGELVGLSVQIGRSKEFVGHLPSLVGDGKQTTVELCQHAEVHVDALRVWGHPV